MEGIIAGSLKRTWTREPLIPDEVTTGMVAQIRDELTEKPKPKTWTRLVKEMTPDEREDCPVCEKDLPDHLQIPPSQRHRIHVPSKAPKRINLLPDFVPPSPIEDRETCPYCGQSQQQGDSDER